MYCRKCGAKLSENTNYCSSCGTPVAGGRLEAFRQQTVSPEARSQKMDYTETVSLVRRLQSGDTRAFDRLYEIYYPKVYALVKNTISNEEDALDILQKTFFSAWQHIGSLTDPRMFHAWVQKIALRYCYDLFRKKNIQILTDANQDNMEIPESMVPDEMLPQVYAEREDLRQRLNTIIDSLPPVQKQTLTLYYYDEFKINEIASIMECSQNTVKSRLFLARNAIRTEIQEEERKSGQKFYGVAGLPMVALGLLFARKTEAAMLPEAKAALLCKTVWQRAVHNGMIRPTQSSPESAERLVQKGVTDQTRSTLTGKPAGTQNVMTGRPTDARSTLTGKPVGTRNTMTGKPAGTQNVMKGKPSVTAAKAVLSGKKMVILVAVLTGAAVAVGGTIAVLSNRQESSVAMQTESTTSSVQETAQQIESVAETIQNEPETGTQQNEPSVETQQTLPISGSGGPVYAPELMDDMEIVPVRWTEGNALERDVTVHRFPYTSHANGREYMVYSFHNNSDKVLKITLKDWWEPFHDYEEGKWNELYIQNLFPNETLTYHAPSNQPVDEVGVAIEEFTEEILVDEYGEDAVNWYSQGSVIREESAQLQLNQYQFLKKEEDSSGYFWIDVVDSKGNHLLEKTEENEELIEHLAFYFFDQDGNLIYSNADRGMLASYPSYLELWRGYGVESNQVDMENPVPVVFVPEGAVKFIYTNFTSGIYGA